ncbi:Calcineurin subunit B [Linum perenne]
MMASINKMGSASSMLTQYDIEQVQEHCHHLFSQQEILSLYKRFCQLDRNAKGYISADEFLSVPEFAMNPLSQQVLTQVIKEAGYSKEGYLLLDDFIKVFGSSGLKMEVEVPAD